MTSDKRALFDAVFNTAARPQTTVTETTMSAKAAQATIPMDDPELNDREANFETLRLIVSNQAAEQKDLELIKARLDGLAEAVAAAVADIKAANAARPAATAAVPSPTGGSVAATTRTVGIVSVYETKAGPVGRQFDKTVVRLSNGDQKDIKATDKQWFTDRIGQEVRVAVTANTKGYETLYPA